MNPTGLIITTFGIALFGIVLGCSVLLMGKHALLSQDTFLRLYNKLQKTAQFGIIDGCNVCKVEVRFVKSEYCPELCDSSAVYGSDAHRDNCRRCPTSASVLAVQSVVCANVRKSTKKRLLNDAGFTAPTTAALSGA